MHPFPEEWSEQLTRMTLDQANPCHVQLASISSSRYPETRTVLLRYLKAKDRIFICTNSTYPKWEQVKKHPYIALSTYLSVHNLALRLKAKGECLGYETDFSREAWRSMPSLHREKYLSMTSESLNKDGPPAIFGCIELDPWGWIIDQTGADGWIEKRQIYERSGDEGWRKSLEIEPSKNE